MDDVVLTTLGIVLLLFLFLFSGQWIGLALASVGVIILQFMVGGNQLALIGRLQFNAANSFVFAAVPLFVFMGYVLIHSGISDLVYKAVTPLVSFIPGGLLHTNVVGGAVFGACCGTSVAGAAAVGSVALPQLKKRNYDRALSYGSLAAGGTMSALIPPSLAFVVYGAWVQESIGALFLAGIVPGIIMTGLFMLYIVVRTLRNPSVAPREVVAARELLRGLMGMLPVVLIVAAVLGSIYSGLATPTEAASVGSVAALAVSAGYRRLNAQVVRNAVSDTVKVTCMVMILVVGAQFLAIGLSMLRVPSALSAWLVALPLSKYFILGLIIIFYIVLGMFMEGTAIMLMSLPIAYPVMMALGFSSVWFGVIVVVMIQVGLLTPPVGVAVFIIHKLSGETDMTCAIRGALPFMLLMLFTAVIITIFPAVATWLPSAMLGRPY
jgi:C4-dicarboxylate transporter, DctM subunit